MKSIISLVIKPEYTIIGGDINLKDLCLNPNPKIAKLIMKNPYYNLIGNNPNPGLTEFIIKNKDKIKTCFMSKNINPMLADLIISFKNIEYDSDIWTNPNPGLTDFLLNKSINFINSLAVSYKLSRNTNPLLAKLIMKNPNWSIISGNSNTGLTDFILSHPHCVDYYSLSSNTNPLLAELIIKNEHRLNWCAIFRNPNIGLTKFIMENYISKCAPHLGYNSNPELTDFIISKLKPNEISESNTNKKLIKYRLSVPNINVGLSANPSAVVIKKIELL